MRKIFFIIWMPFLINAQETAKSEIVNPDGKWYFGAEMGLNTMASFKLGEPNKSFQGGVVAEYYTGRHWSLSGRIKYFETGVSFYKPNTHSGGWFDLGSDEYSGVFKGAVISIPINIKWEFRIFKNFGGSLKLGYAQNFETKSNYTNYSANLKTDYSKSYGSSISGLGFNYFLNQKTAIYIDFERYFGGRKAKIPALIFDNDQYVMNNLINIGIKYNLKK
jgi:hypothetical protein